MSSATPVSAAPSSAPHPLLLAAARPLATHFRGPEDDAETACARAQDAIAAYGPVHPSEFILIGACLALSLAAMHATSRALDPALSTAQHLQFLTKATSLRRAAAQAEAALAHARRHAPPSPAGSDRTNFHQQQAAHSAAPGPPEIMPSEPVSPEPVSPEPVSSEPASFRRAFPAGSAPDTDDPLQALINQVMAEKSPSTGQTRACQPVPAISARPTPLGPKLGRISPALADPMPKPVFARR